MKPYLQPALTVLLLAVFSYLIGAFMAADWNIANWNEHLRHLVACVFVLWGAGYGMRTNDKT